MITPGNVEALKDAGYRVISFRDGCVTVADPVQCSTGGGKRWTEDRPVTLRTYEQLLRFVMDRS